MEEKTIELPPCPCCGDASPEFTVSSVPIPPDAEVNSIRYRAKAEYQCTTCGFNISAEGFSFVSGSKAEKIAVRMLTLDIEAIAKA